LAGILILGKAVYNIFFPEQIKNILEGITIIAATGVVNFVLGTYLVRQGKHLNSLTIVADGKHLQVDAYSTLGLLFGLLLLYITGIHQIDILLSLGLGAYIVYSGYRLLRKSIAGLMDESDFELIDHIARILDEHRQDAWIDVHNLRVQRYGHELHVDCHVTLPNYYDLVQVHEEVSKIDRLINQYVHVDTELFIHADPCLPACCHYCNMPNCPIRSVEKNTNIRWNAELLTRNKKHFDRFADQS